MLRRLDEVEAVGKQIEEIHTPIASFWKGLAAQRLGAGNLDHAQKLLEYAASCAPRNYQARALLILGSVAEYRRDQKSEAEFYRRAMSLNASDLYAKVEGQRAVAILRAIEGDHQQAIALLENTLPVAHYYRAHSPYVYLQSLNSLAVEYQAVGKLREAFELARIATASPLAFAYPEWKETRAEIEQEIQERERAPVFVVVPAPQRERRPQRRVTISYQIVESRARRLQALKPTIGRAPVIRSMVERVATVAPIHAPPFSL